jgi:hypothetical protein
MPETTLLDVMAAANAVYPDGFLAEYFDAEDGLPNTEHGVSKGKGDTLAEFIVNEISEKWEEPGILSPEDPAAAAEKVQQCASAIRTAESQLAAVAKALENLSDSLQPPIEVEET